MQFDKEAAFVLVRGELMDGQSPSLSDCANLLEEVFVAARAGFDMHDDVSIRHDFFDVLFHRFARAVSLFETGRARDAHRDVNEVTLSGAADADTFAAKHAFGIGYGG